jgi:hypothetical protein
MQHWPSRFPLLSLRALYWWGAGRELFYRTAAKAAIADRVASVLALMALGGGVVCIALRPLTESGPILMLLALVALVALSRESARVLVYLGVAVGLFATRRGFSWPIDGLAAANLLAAAFVMVEQWYRRRWTFKPMHLGNTNVGSARLLRGRVAIEHLFLASRPAWNARQVRASLKRTREATRWLSKEAQRFGVPVDFSHRRIEAASECWIAEVPHVENEYKGILEFERFLQRQLAITGESSETTSDDRATNRCLLVHVADWTNERAFAQPEIHGDTDGGPGVEYAVVGANESSATIAHELLHLFGADDYYFDGRYDAGLYSGQVGEWLDAARFGFLRRCVMFRSCESVRELSVDDQTAQKIGWL